MAREIAEIKESITSDFMRNPDVAKAYGFETGTAFSEKFSRASIENLLFYIVACATWVLETLFDKHRQDVEERIEAIMPHRPKWYRDKALNFMKGKTLQPDTDIYDTSGMGEEDIDAAKVVKYAAATENEGASILTVKIAGESGGKRCPLDDVTKGQFEAYLTEIKDAGVRISVVNQAPDRFDCEADIYYDPLAGADDVKASCEKTIADYIENLPFNGEYTNMELTNRLQQIEGVKIVELLSAQTFVQGESTPTKINARYTTASGYFTGGTIKVNMKPYR